MPAPVYAIEPGSIIELVSQLDFPREVGTEGEARGFRVIRDRLSKLGAAAWFEEFPTSWIEISEAFLQVGDSRLTITPLVCPVFNGPWHLVAHFVDEEGMLVDSVPPQPPGEPQILLRTSLDRDTPCVPGASAQLFACPPEDGFAAYHVLGASRLGKPLPSAYVDPEAVGFLRGCVGSRCLFHWETAQPERMLRNLVAEVRGTKRPEEVVAVGAHLDSFPGTVGANDNASGCARLVQFVRWFLENPPARTVRFIWFTGEELDRRGSNAYVAAHHTDREAICLFVEVDGGVSVDHEPFGLDVGDSGAVAQVVEDALVLIRAGSGGGPFKRTGDRPGASDAAPFHQMGIPALYAPGGGKRRKPGPNPHLPTDTVDRLDPTNILTASVVALALIDAAQKYGL